MACGTGGFGGRHSKGMAGRGLGFCLQKTEGKDQDGRGGHLKRVVAISANSGSPETTVRTGFCQGWRSVLCPSGRAMPSQSWTGPNPVHDRDLELLTICPKFRVRLCEPSSRSSTWPRTWMNRARRPPQQHRLLQLIRRWQDRRAGAAAAPAGCGVGLRHGWMLANDLSMQGQWLGNGFAMCHRNFSPVSVCASGSVGECL